MRRGEEMLSQLQSLCLSVMEQPKNEVKGDWRGLTLEQMMGMLRHEFEKELLPEYLIYHEDPAQGIEGMIREIPGVVILCGMIYERLMEMLIRDTRKSHKAA